MSPILSGLRYTRIQSKQNRQTKYDYKKQNSQDSLPQWDYCQLRKDTETWTKYEIPTPTRTTENTDLLKTIKKKS